MEPYNSNGTGKKIALSAVAVIVVIALLAAVSSYEGSHPSTMNGATQPTTGQGNLTQVEAGNTTFKDGTYTASSSYYVPNGTESIQVSLTIKNNAITNSSIQNSEGNPTSSQYQQAFASQYKSAVVGKKANSVQLSYVAGASDTTNGFDDALAQILTQAKA